MNTRLDLRLDIGGRVSPAFVSCGLFVLFKGLLSPLSDLLPVVLQFLFESVVIRLPSMAKSSHSLESF